jgi:hypothetical protein
MLQHRHACTHAVLFYRDDATVQDRVGAYVTRALRAGQSALVIARPALVGKLMIEVHRQHVQGLPFDARRGRLVVLDVAATLEKVCRDGKPQRGLFMEVVGGALRDLAGTSPAPVAAYGEMVGVLCERGQYADAVVMEQMWNELLVTQHASLFCGYARSLFASAQSAPFMEVIRAEHSDVEDEAAAPA